MKVKYEKPIFTVETFVPNVAIAACNYSDMGFECLTGGNTKDTRRVVSDSSYFEVIDISGCSIKVRYADGATQAKKIKSTSGTSGTSTVNGNQVYNAPNGADGMLYFCISDTTTIPNFDYWEEPGQVLTHKEGHPKRENWHCQVAAVVKSTVSSV